VKTIFFLSVLILLVGCDKPGINGGKCSGNCYVLTGKVVDTPSNAGLKGVELKFYHRTSGGWIFDPTTYLGRTSTNADGEYTFQFDGTNYKKGTGYFLLEPIKSGYFYTSPSSDEVKKFYLDSSNFNIPVDQRIRLFRKATMQVRIRPTSGTKFEFLTILYQHGTNATGIALNRNQIVDTTITFQTAGDIHTLVQWSAVGNGVSSVSKKDTLFTTQGGTVQYRIDL
jgi:hypothetical protein